MQREPLFQVFDIGWLAIIVVLMLACALWWEIHRPDEPVHDDDEDWDVENRRPDPEADARHWPF